MSIEKGRAYAQIDIEFLLKMPILALEEEEEKKLEEFYLEKSKTAKKGESFVSFSLSDLI
ncbi:MAG: hypothetical protein H7641_08010 [Candidatus Heimdallarchaeota archaeon]|nr:hypothetical protein [Candidatus Heimdallarchaeota archaeon]